MSRCSQNGIVECLLFILFFFVFEIAILKYSILTNLLELKEIHFAFYKILNIEVAKIITSSDN